MSQHLRRYLGSGDALAKLQDHAHQLRRLQAALEAALPPPLASQYRVANLKECELIVFAQSGATAVRLKQLVPSLIAQLQRAGHAVQTIKVRLADPRVRYTEPLPPPARILSTSARNHLQQFAASLPEQSALRDAVERLARRSRSQ
ncbi:MAG: DUF721 domain-containing protein [Thauera propionica]|nr:DUF721 domain-containing protein [Thauera propionica]